MSDIPYQAIPAPGSKEAVDKGCTCPTIDNRHGLGWPNKVTGEPDYWYNGACPLHGTSTRNNQPE